jgi:hypothetical protein
LPALRPSFRRLLVLGALSVFVPWQVSASTTRAGSAGDLAHIESIAARIRGLKQTHGVTARFPSNAAFNAELKNELLRDNPDSVLAISQREMVLLGLLKKGQNLKQIYLNGLANPSSVVGLYDYKTSTLFVRNQSKQAFGVDRYVIAHEYTHALQDQHWHLAKLLPDQNALAYRNSDAVEAHHALTEGDAYNVQTLFISREYSPSDIQALRDEAAQSNGSPLPTALRRAFYFAYVDGYAFAKALYDQGGMALVNAAYKRLPASTYEIMHPSAYLRHWRPVHVMLHGIQGYGDWKQVDDDVYGAMGYDILIWQYASSKRAGAAVTGYRGDRYIFLENGDQDAIVMKSVWASSRAVSVARAAIASSLRTRFSGSRWTNGGTTLSYAGGGAYLGGRGKSLVLALAPSVELAKGMAIAPST